jgi:DNA-directed RNA polymerase subunit omega
MDIRTNTEGGNYMADVPNENPDKIGSRFAMVMAVAKRAKQIREGSPKLVECKSKNPITVAMEEIAAGMVSMRIPSQEEIEIAERMESIPKAASAAREAAELLRVTEHEEETQGEELPEEVAEISAAVVDVTEAEPSVEESEEVEEDTKSEASAAETDELDDTDEEVEEEETPADESE